MIEPNQKTIEEMFMIRTKEIEVVGSLIKETPEEFSSKGTVNFRDGTFWAFQSPPGERCEIKKKLEDMFEKTAAFYDTEIIYHSFKMDLSQEGSGDPSHTKPRFLN
ncbi:hypothetical protein [Desulfospira joergensenii]|uniref:hypothetical protein n=1 Tax=Desulfospira joergensenii TaxID=53329 RepID=UPI0003B52DC3|nr:hypothetical protein [Desulfospira joergensenii]